MTLTEYLEILKIMTDLLNATPRDSPEFKAYECAINAIRNQHRLKCGTCKKLNNPVECPVFFAKRHNFPPYDWFCADYKSSGGGGGR